MDLLRVSDPIEQALLREVLERANEADEARYKTFMENIAVAVQIGVAKAFPPG